MLKEFSFKVFTAICLLGTGTTTLAQTVSPCYYNQLPTALQNGLVAYYPFCGNASDAGQNGYHGAVSNATLAADRFGNAGSAYNFDCLNCYIDVNTAFFDPKWSKYTVSCWTKPTNLNLPKQVFFNTTPHVGVSLGIREPDQDYFGFGVSSDGSAWDVTYNMVNGTTPVANTWFHHALVKNGNVFSYYINTVLVDTKTITNTFTLNSPTKLRLGAILLPPYTDYQYHGLADDYMIYNRALTPGEITSLFNLSVVSTDLKPGHSALQNINIYPNPSSGVFNVLLPTNTNISVLNIYNGLGDLVENRSLTGGLNVFTLNLSKGIYLISFHSPEGERLGTKRVVCDK